MNAQFKVMRTAKIRNLFTVLELEAQDKKPNIHVMQVAEREIALEIKLIIDATCKRVSDQLASQNEKLVGNTGHLDV